MTLLHQLLRNPLLKYPVHTPLAHGILLFAVVIARHIKIEGLFIACSRIIAGCCSILPHYFKPLAIFRHSTDHASRLAREALVIHVEVPAFNQIIRLVAIDLQLEHLLLLVGKERLHLNLLFSIFGRGVQRVAVTAELVKLLLHLPHLLLTKLFALVRNAAEDIHLLQFIYVVTLAWPELLNLFHGGSAGHSGLSTWKR